MIVVNGQHIAEKPNSTVPQEVLKKVYAMHGENFCLAAILASIRKDLLPAPHQMVMWPGYVGVSEALRTIICTYR